MKVMAKYKLSGQYLKIMPARPKNTGTWDVNIINVIIILKGQHFINRYGMMSCDSRERRAAYKLPAKLLGLL